MGVSASTGERPGVSEDEHIHPCARPIIRVMHIQVQDVGVQVSVLRSLPHHQAPQGLRQRGRRGGWTRVLIASVRGYIGNS